MKNVKGDGSMVLNGSNVNINRGSQNQTSRAGPESLEQCLKINKVSFLR